MKNTGKILIILILQFVLIVPALQAQDFAINSIIDIEDAADIKLIRRDLNTCLFGPGGFPFQDLPDTVTSNIHDEDFTGMEDLKEITRLSMEMEWGLNSIAYLFIPRKANNQLVIYHQGHNGKFSLGKNTIEALLKEGFHVVGMSMLLLGKNRKPVIHSEELGRICISYHEMISLLIPTTGHPVRYFLDPVARVVNYVQQFNFDRISMIGISGGGWATTLYAAIDPRIACSFPVAGSLPMYLRLKEEEPNSVGDYEQFAPEIYRIANYLELYILGAYGERRRQLQILNEFDNCCFSGRGYTSYEGILIDKMEHLGKGSFNVRLDSSHREHKISGPAIEWILTILRDPTVKFTR